MLCSRTSLEMKGGTDSMGMMLSDVNFSDDAKVQ